MTKPFTEQNKSCHLPYKKTAIQCLIKKLRKFPASWKDKKCEISTVHSIIRKINFKTTTYATEGKKTEHKRAIPNDLQSHF